MAYLSDDELLDTEGGFTGWDDETGTGATEETLEQALAEERLAELEKMCIRDRSSIWQASTNRSSKVSAGVLGACCTFQLSRRCR